MKNKDVEKLLLLILDEISEYCRCCEKLGQNLPECKCMENKECAKHLLKLYKKQLNK